MNSIERFKNITEIEDLGQYEGEVLYNFIYNYSSGVEWVENTQKDIILQFVNHIYNMGRNGQ